MTKPKLTLNIRSPNGNGNELSKAAETKRNNIETIDEAWTRILAMKNSRPEERRLREVKSAMDAGKIGREPESAGRRFSKAEALRLWRTLDEMRAEERLRELVDDMPGNYVLVTDKDVFKGMIADLSLEDKVVFDVETTGTDVYSDKIVGHVLSATSTDLHYYIPTDHDDNMPQLGRDYVAEQLRPLYENPNIKFIAHNAKWLGVVKPLS